MFLLGGQNVIADPLQIKKREYKEKNPPVKFFPMK
jgi:hypothetical protein